jgi:AAA domain, putative AbiEii toxin, Type IV TA system/AAA domain
VYVDRVKIDGIRGFHGERATEVQLGDRTRSHAVERHSGLTVVAGRNGSGKSTFLRAIAAGLSGPDVTPRLTEADLGWVSQGRPHGEIEVGLIPPGAETGDGPADLVTTHLRWRPARPDRSRPEGALSSGGRRRREARPGDWPSTQSGWFSAGYGPYRRLTGTSADVVRLTVDDHVVQRFATLFREEASLAETVQWLQQVNYRARSGQAGYDDLDARMLALLNDGLLPDGLQAQHVDPDGLWLRDRNATVLRINEMSDGYRAVTALVTDIVRQIHECFDGQIAWQVGAVPRIMTAGVVLIDEIDAHLHVTWQKSIGNWLRTHFPQIQFIVTTHSPYVCQSARPGGLIRLPGPNDAGGAQIVDDELYRRVVHGSGDDGVLTELFGLDSPYSDRTEDLRRRLTTLETAALRGQADDDQLAELAELTETIVPSPSSRVRDAGPYP